jgi:hypothetical protein
MFRVSRGGDGGEEKGGGEEREAHDSITNRLPEKLRLKRREAGIRRPHEYDSPKELVMIAYFFFADFFAPPFLAGAFFLAAISAHHLSLPYGISRSRFWA